WVVGGLAFGPDGGLLATGGWDQQVKLWNGRSGAPVAPLLAPLPAPSLGGVLGYLGPSVVAPERFAFHGHEGRVRAVAISPDGRRLAVASGDARRGEVKVWDLTQLERADGMPAAP